MQLPKIEPIINSGSLRAILESQELAQLGDFLVNFVYSCVKIGIKGNSGSVHVWDSSLRDAMELSNLRSKLGKNTKPDRVADGAEAFVAYCYFKEIMSLEEMIEFLSRRLIPQDFEVVTMEKEACASAFSELLQRLAYIVKKNAMLDY